MDIVTHAVISGILASSVAEQAPLTACAFVLGSALPDLDVFARLAGKRAFIRAHQSWTHSISLIALLTAVLWFVFHDTVPEEPWWPLTVPLGMLFHVLLDLSNSYGVALLLPFNRQRLCLEWVFFIDAGVWVASGVAIVFLAIDYLSTGSVRPRVGLTYGAFILLYWTGRWWLRQRAHRHSPAGTFSLVPSALWPHQFFGLARQSNALKLFVIDGWRGHRSSEEDRHLQDERYLPILERLPEFRVMREFSPAYHVVSAQDENGRVRLRLRDLRHRNFGGRFGELDLTVDQENRVQSVTLHV